MTLMNELIKECRHNEELIDVCNLDFKDVDKMDAVDRERLAIRRFSIKILGLENAYELREFLNLPKIQSQSLGTVNPK